MEPSWLTELRNTLSDDEDLVTVVIAEFDLLRGRVDELSSSNTDLDDRLRHMNHALRMVSQVRPTEEGANMAKGIAEEALSAVGVD